MLRGVVQRTGGGVYEVGLEDGRVVEASLRGRLKLQERTGERVVIGDRVLVATPVGEASTIEAVEPRERQIVRQGPGGRSPKVVAANVDRMLAVLAAGEPEPRPVLADRLLVTAEANDIEPVLVLNKMDLPGADDVAGTLGRLYESIGYPVVRVSAVTGKGLAELEPFLCTGTAALVGPSGTGKSSLLNAFQPGLGLRTGALSRRLRSGRHTTVTGRLLQLGCGGRVADTPGFSDMGVWGMEADRLGSCFPEFGLLADACRFRGCLHLHEPACAVKEALEEGRVAESRYASYLALLEEARAR